MKEEFPQEVNNSGEDGEQGGTLPEQAPGALPPLKKSPENIAFERRSSDSFRDKKEAVEKRTYIRMPPPNKLTGTDEKGM